MDESKVVPEAPWVNVKICSQAYCTIVCHSVKHPAAPVLGVVLGSPIEKLSKPVQPLKCDMAIPLLHGNIYNVPLLGLGLTMVFLYIEEKKIFF